MITGKAIYDVFSALVPLYAAMFLAYGSVRWWKTITVEQCAGINRYVSVIAVPVLGFYIIHNNDLYTMNFRFIAADCIQKLTILAALLAWQAISKRGSLDWTISLFSICTLPNTLVMGVPLLEAMYGEFAGPLMVQIVVMQVVVWYNILLVLLEYRAAKELFSKQLPPEATRAVASFRVESDVHSLACSEPLQTEAEIREDGKIEVVIRRSASCPRPNNLGSNRNLRTHSDLAVYSMRSDYVMARQPSFCRAYSDCYKVSPVNADMVGGMNTEHSFRFDHGENKKGGIRNINVQTFDHSSGRRQNVERDKEHAVISSDALIVVPTPADTQREAFPITTGATEKNDGDAVLGGTESENAMPSTFVMIKLIASMACRKIFRNPNTYASACGLVWSLISSRWGFGMPKIIEGSVTILSNTGMGMSMFSLGLFMAEQPKIITCGIKAAVFSMAVRFVVGPAMSAVSGAIVGLRGNLLRVAVVQAALPQAIVSFVFARQYDCHAELLSTSVIFGIIVSLPVTIIYYIVIGL